MAPLRGHLNWGIAALVGWLLFALPFVLPLAINGVSGVSGVQVMLAVVIVLFMTVPSIFKVAERYGAVREPDFVRVRGPVLVSTHSYQKGRPSAFVYLPDGHRFSARDTLVAAIRRSSSPLREPPAQVEKDRLQETYAVGEAVTVYSRAASIIIEILDVQGGEVFMEPGYKYHPSRRDRATKGKRHS